MVDSLKAFQHLYQGFTKMGMGQQNFGELFTLNQPYMRWSKGMMDMFSTYSGSNWGSSMTEYQKLYLNYFTIFQKAAIEYPLSTMEMYQQLWGTYQEKYREVIQEWHQEQSQDNEKNYPADWDEEKEFILIESVITGTKEAKTLASIFEKVSEEIGISPARCSTYWYTKVEQSYRDQVSQIKQELAENWTEEEEELLTKIITEEYPHLSIYQTFPIASRRLKRHKTDVQRKWFSLLTRDQQGIKRMS
ncbi:hypothetical protein [Niallia oryzisoli]|uniref:hypothetical protein n=1 Tax=Niallia oryzisoli TaxID=1737571 RepID=UPI0037366476